MTDPEQVNIELNSEKSEKANKKQTNAQDKEKVEKQLKLFKIVAIVGVLLAIIFLVILIIVAATGDDDDDDDNKSSTTAVASVYNTWEQLNSTGAAPSIRLAHGSAVYNKELLIIYGLQGTENDDLMLDDIWSYSPEKKVWNQWNTSGTAPSGRYHFASAVYKNSLYMHGGFLNFEGEEESSQEFFRLDLVTKVWEDLTIKDAATKQPDKRGAHEMVEYNGSFYLFGGSVTVSAGLFNDLWKYDIAKKEWEQIEEKDDWPSSRLGFNLYTADNALWIFGGTCNPTEEENCDNGQQNDMWKFYPNNNTWVELVITGENIPMARRASHAEVTISEHTFLIGGLYISKVDGKPSPLMLNDVHVYDILKNSWIQLHPEWPDEAKTLVMPKRFGHSVEEINNKLYVFGGRCGTPAVYGCNDLWVYTPPYFASQAAGSV